MARFWCIEPASRRRGACRGLAAAAMFVWATAVAAVWQGRPVAELLEGLRRAGIQVLYSSDLVTQTLTISVEPHAATILGQATEVLAPHGLMLEEVGPRQYIVVRRPASTADDNTMKLPGKPAAIVAASGVLHEITVYSSRYAFDSRVDTPLSLSQGEIEAVPGTRNDALRAAHSRSKTIFWCASTVFRSQNHFT